VLFSTQGDYYHYTALSAGDTAKLEQDPYHFNKDFYGIVYKVSRHNAGRLLKREIRLQVVCAGVHVHSSLRYAKRLNLAASKQKSRLC
jgi:hypothetical protein